MRVVFLGAPGVGKGTQADRIATQFKILKISTGDLLREAVRNQTQLGLEAKSYMDQGKLVPDSVVIGLVRDKLGDPGGAKGFVLDGFPRTVTQAEELGKALQDGPAAFAPRSQLSGFSGRHHQAVEWPAELSRSVRRHFMWTSRRRKKATPAIDAARRWSSEATTHGTPLKRA